MKHATRAAGLSKAMSIEAFRTRANYSYSVISSTGTTTGEEMTPSLLKQTLHLYKSCRSTEAPIRIPFGFIERGGVDLFFQVGMYSPFPLSTAGTVDSCDGCETEVDLLLVLLAPSPKAQSLPGQGPYQQSRPDLLRQHGCNQLPLSPLCITQEMWEHPNCRASLLQPSKQAINTKDGVTDLYLYSPKSRNSTPATRSSSNSSNECDVDMSWKNLRAQGYL